MSRVHASDVLESVDPATGEVVFTHPVHTEGELDEILDAAVSAQKGWARVPVDDRARAVGALAVALRRERDRLADLVTLEMGKPIVEARAEIDKCIATCEFYAEAGPRMIAAERVESPFEESEVHFEPLGVVLAIMPWNYPMWQVVRLLAPAFVAGDAVVLKHASNVTQCALALERVALEAGLPAGLLGALLCRSGAVAGIIADDRVASVSLTGSTEVGTDVAARAGAALKPQVLELGGSDAFIVFDDAEIEEAAAAAVRARNQNAGQSCVAAKRFLVHATVFPEFVERVVAHTELLRIGDPRDPDTRIGPLARPDLRDTLAGQISRSLERGAVLAAGGQELEGPGNFFSPAVLTGVTTEMAVFREETFGPVAPIMPFGDAEEAIALASDSEFGLGASVWTADRDRARAVARELQVGSVYINARVSSEPRLPFGGTKRSGYGRELGSFGIRELTNIKTVAIAATG